MKEPSRQHLYLDPSSTFFRRTIVPEVNSEADEEAASSNSKEE